MEPAVGRPPERLLSARREGASGGGSGRLAPYKPVSKERTEVKEGKALIILQLTSHVVP
jgi:hypothetical protein